MRSFPFLCALLLTACSMQQPKDIQQAGLMPAPPSDEPAQVAEPFAIVELFTSEGCNSCPPAEDLLNELTVKAMADKSYVYPLAFHVDYWNKLGWKDRFSSAAFSDRQRKYREAFEGRVVYTPQMIVNGATEFVGSSDDKAHAAIDAALSDVPPLYFSIEPNEAWTSLTYDMISAPEGFNPEDYHFHVALVERGLTTEVTRGENKSKTLDHENVVIAFTQHTFSTDGATLTIPAPENGPRAEHSLITFVQHKETMKIIGANLWNF